VNKIIIAIDGYSSCGKTTTAKGVAEALNYRFIDTGAMYRAVTLYMIENNIDVQNENAVNKALDAVEIDFEVNEENGSSEILLNGRYVEKQIRNMTVSYLVSKVSKWPAVRHKMVAQQRKMGAQKAIVMDGRDIGTNVFPNAELKVFVTAEIETRVARRMLEFQSKNEQIDAQEIRKNLEQRDLIDQTRKENPLMQANDAILLDTTHMGIEEQIQWVLEKTESQIKNHA
jgi:cytidylate kinase